MLSSRDMIRVVAAIIEDAGRVLICQRRGGPFALKWEFPGGKIKQGESPGQCVVREVSEELNLDIAVGQSLPSVSHDYPDFSVTLYPFICAIVSGEITLHEHKALLWLSSHELRSLDWVAANFPIISAYCDRPKKRNF